MEKNKKWKDRCSYLKNFTFEGVGCINCAFNHSCPYDDNDNNGGNEEDGAFLASRSNDRK